MNSIFKRTGEAFNLLFRPGKSKVINTYFQLLDGYTPIFRTYDGGVYEMELTRACIHAFANHASKLQPNVTGADLRGIKRILEGKPNFLMTSAQFLYKVATIYDAQNTCWIVPILDDREHIVGYYPANPQQTELVKTDDGQPWLRFTFGDGSKGAMELERCGVVSKYLYNNDLYGESNEALRPTMQLLATQNQGIEEGIKNSASFRFMANLSNFSKADDLKRERKKFVEENLGPDSGGLALFPSTYSNVQQITSSPDIVNSAQMTLIQERVYNYFGTNSDILQNKSVGDSWSAFYEGKVEPFAIQLSQAMTCMTYSDVERARDNAIVWSANRLQYLSNKDKLESCSQMFDRGIWSVNDVNDVWNMPHVPDGNKHYIRKEYTEISQLDQVSQLQQELTNAQNALNAAKAPQEPGPEDDEGGPEDGNTEQ